MKESSRMVMPFSFSFSSISEWLDPLGADVVHDLDPLPLLHVEDRQLAEDAVGIPDVANVDRQIVEEARGPQPPEVAHQGLFERLVVGNPPVLARTAGACLDVIKVGVRIDDGRPALLLETEHVAVEDRTRRSRRRAGRRRYLLPAEHGRQRQGDDLRRRSRRGCLGSPGPPGAQPARLGRRNRRRRRLGSGTRC